MEPCRIGARRHPVAAVPILALLRAPSLGPRFLSTSPRRCLSFRWHTSHDSPASASRLPIACQTSSAKRRPSLERSSPARRPSPVVRCASPARALSPGRPSSYIPPTSTRRVASYRRGTSHVPYPFPRRGPLPRPACEPPRWSARRTTPPGLAPSRETASSLGRVTLVRTTHVSVTWPVPQTMQHAHALTPREGVRNATR
jgi:hypothetical protein